MSTIRPKKDAQTLNGNPISTADPAPGDALVWDGSEWAPTAGGGGGGGVPLNFSQTKGAQVTITAAEAKPATVVSVTITTAGNPVQIIVSGDANPSGAGTWGLLNIYRDAVAIGQNVQFESSAANENVPYCLQVVDEPAAGTWTYSLKVVSVTANTQFGENAGPIITVTELGAEAGGGGGTIDGTIASAEIAFGTGVDTIGGSSNLTWNGNTVFVESSVDASGITVQDTGVSVITDVQSGAISMASGFDQAYISGKDVLLRFRSDTLGGLIATIAALDESSVAAPLDLEVGELQINTDPGMSGYVLTSNGAGVAPSWQAVGGGSFVPISTSDYIIAMPGDDLFIKYGLAKLLTPGGNPLSSTNRAALIILPGNYILPMTLILDAEFVDIVGLGGATKKPAVHISGDNIQADADDIRVSNLDMGTRAISVGNSLTNQVFQNCTGGNGMFQAANEVAGTFIDCVGGDDSFTGAAVVASGRFIRCDAGGGAIGCFGFDASGYFEDCTATGDYAFGGFANSYGTFVRCTASGNTTFGALGIASGIYIDCKATGTDSFGSGGVANGTFTRCTATGAGSFGGGNSGLALPSGCRGVFDHCVGGLSSFGDSAEGYAPTTRGISGQLYFCRATIGTFYNFRVLTAVCTPGTPASFDVSPDDHNYSVGTPVRFSTTGLMPTGALASKTYFVASTPTNSTFTLETYQGSGVGIDTTDAGTGTLTVTSGRLVHCVDGYNEPFTV